MSEAATSHIVGVAAPLLRDNIDTDAIIPSHELTAVAMDDLGERLFSTWRYDAGRRERPCFVLNREPFRKASILVAGHNFGCGSSREPAAWALKQFGIRAIIAKSFGGIFRKNAVNNGLAPIILGEAEVEALVRLIEAAPERKIDIDLQDCRVGADQEQSWRFILDPVDGEIIRSGVRPIDLTMRMASEVAEFARADQARRPWVYSHSRRVGDASQFLHERRRTDESH